MSIMKNLFFLFIIFQSLFLYSQNRKDYFVVVKPGYAYAPLQATVNQDETLSFQMTDSAIENFLNSIPIYSLHKAFPTAYSPFLQRTYRVTLDNETYLDDFFQRNEIEYVELVEEENIELFIPNDYNYMDRGTPNTALEIIKAPLAWNLTQGNPSILGGVLDLGSGQASHGASVASAVAGQTDNNVGLASIGFETKLAIKSGGGHNGALLLSQQPGVKVINISLKFGCTFSPVAAEVFSEIWNGTPQHPPVVVVAAAGNGKANQSAGGSGWCPDANGGANGYVYPAAYDNVIAVSALCHLVPRGTEDFEFGYGVNWEDLALRDINDPNSTTTFNDKVDLSAPGRHVLAANDDSNGYGYAYGTSIASPIVAGTVALMLDVNPNLTPDEVRDILRNTTDDIYYIPENVPFTNLYGTGRLNAFRAIKTAQCMANPTSGLDLAMQNSDEDTFIEPDTETEFFWRSNDIWVRNQDDGREVRFHQNPIYDPNNHNYVYVRITNNSCVTSAAIGNELKLYWSKANTSLSWPDHWDGSLYMTDPDTSQNVLMGDIIGGKTIPKLEPGESTILEFQWTPPNPDDYVNINENPWHFCLLARIKSNDDPMTVMETDNLAQNILNNNNIAMKNTTVLEFDSANPSPIGGVIAIGNATNQTKTYELKFSADANEPGKAIYDEAEVSINMDNIIYNAWDTGGKAMNNTDATRDPKKVLVTDNNAVLGNIQLAPGEIGTVYLKFNFLTQELTNKKHYIYHVSQWDTSTQEIIGGETYEINKVYRDAFMANAGSDREIERNESTTLIATTINEDATYNWYDPEGNLIYTGTQLTISPEITKTYKLEIVSNIDGFKDYDEVEVTVSPYKLESLIPNPASNIVTINYTADEATSAYVMIVNNTTGSSDNYIIDTSLATIDVDLSNYQEGLYSVILVCGGEIQSSKTLVKN